MKNDELQKPLSGPDFSSYDKEQVQWLLKDISNFNIEQPTEDREESIQNGGAHYSESLPIEYIPSNEYYQLFDESLEQNSSKIAWAVAILSEQIYEVRHRKPILVSLARAGTPIGILIKKYLKFTYNYDAPHYAISIVRGRGIDYNALNYISQNHDENNVMFIDGWTGKGAITKELNNAINDFNEKTGKHYKSDIAVLADPGSCVKYYGTREDYLIPSACLNSTVSGLVSRTVLNTEFISKNDYHGAKFYQEFMDSDRSQKFLEEVSKYFTKELSTFAKNELTDSVSKDKYFNSPTWEGWNKIEEISKEYEINDVNLVKPGVGETTRVLLRRVPWRILIRPRDKKDLKHIILLAEQRGVPIEERNDLPYAVLGLIHPKYTKGAVSSNGMGVKGE